MAFDDAHPLQATNNPFSRDLALFELEVRQAFGWKTLRFVSGDWVRDALVDLSACSRSAFFIATYPDSFFSRFIAEERLLLGKPAGTYHSIPAMALR